MRSLWLSRQKDKRPSHTTGPFIYFDMTAFPGRRDAPFPGYGFCSPGKRSATGELAAHLVIKHKSKRPGLPTEPFVYVTMTAAFPGGGAAHLVRATVFVAPVSAAPPGELVAHLVIKHKSKRPGLPTEPFVYVAMTAAFPGGGAAHLFRATGSVAPVSAAPPGELVAHLVIKHKSKRPGLPTEPFVYVAMTAAFPGGGAAHLFRATVFVAPVSAAPPGGLVARLIIKHKNKRPGLPTEPFVYVDMTAAFPGGDAAHLVRTTGSVAPVSAAPPGELAARLAVKDKKQKAQSFVLFDAWQ